MNKVLLPILLLAVSWSTSLAQSSTQDLYYIDNRGTDALLAPRIGIGAGVFTYFGDVNDNNYQHIFTSTYGVEVLASANLSRYFDLNLTGIYGNVTVNERSTASNRNFKSEMFIGSAGISYNFNHLYKRPGIVQPFIGFGVAFINFDSKTDKYDANGNQYYYWSNGSIRSLPENDPLANEETTPILQRDYVYETDLRDENEDDLGKYDQFTFSLPVSAGLDFKMGRRISAKLSAGFYYTFTDLIDDISDKGEGARKGNSRNDMLLFSSLSVSYSIGVNRVKSKSAKSKYYEEFDFYEMQIVDSDLDGVNDFDDQCAQTPNGVKVDDKGCPVDSDLDVIADYRDEEDSTKTGSVVNLKGIALTEKMMLESYADSMATERSKMNLIYPSGILAKRKTLNAEDSTKLAILMLEIQNEIEAKGDFEELFDELSKQIFDQSPAVANSVESVYSNVDRIYKEMVKTKAIASDKPLVITKEKNTASVIPPQFRDADYNNDGLITADEVMIVIESVLDGESKLSISQLYNLIDFYNEYMKGTQVIDFGGTKAVYVNGTLNILDNYKPDGRTNTQRFLANKFKDIDYNNDGILSPDEVSGGINLFQLGQSNYTERQINELIDLFFED